MRIGVVIVAVAAVAAVGAVALALAPSSERELRHLNWSIANARAAAPQPPRQSRDRDRRHRKVPTAAALRDAAAYAGRRDGIVAFAVLNTEGKLRGRRMGRLFPAASTVKAMLLAAEVQRLEREHQPLDEETESLLRSMITYSDNDAADAIYARFGDAGMFRIARQAGMDRFTEAGHWGNAQIDAADLARLHWSMQALVDGPHRVFGLGLLGSVIAEQSWGIPEAARPKWSVRFKGGWLPDRALVHQGAELRADGRRLSIGVLTDEQPSFEYGTETVRGVAARLLSGSRDRGSRRGGA
ncbi:MAG TPA: serine hydrolase [Solirubrobacterales bacterium]|nr:serine hydrolase [Solirubrobacterales bacterium]